MRVLLDTHAFLWFIAGSSQLSSRARETIEDDANSRWVSVCRLWEIGIKVSLGRLRLAPPFGDFIPAQMERNGFALLPLAVPHVAAMMQLPFHHRDPFDRILAGQSLADHLPLISKDAVFDQYRVNRLW